ncbi:hypothetical protein [Bacillus sp. NPDC094106]
MSKDDNYRKNSSSNKDVRNSSSQSQKDLYQQGYVKKKGCNCNKNK